MKRVAVVLMMTAAVVAGTVFAAGQEQKKGTQKGTGATAEELKALENQWVEALTKGDTATLDSIFADAYVDTDEQGHRSDKKGVLAMLKSGDLKLESIKLSDMRVYNYGDAAVVIGSGEQKGTFKGEKVPAEVIFTDTFVRRNGKWKAVASHRSVA